MRPAIEPVSAKRKPWISRSSILILSGILIGMGVQLPMSVAMHKSILGAGTVGLLSFLVLDVVARLNLEVARQRARARANWTLQVRIHKHIPRLRPYSLRKSVIGSPMRDASYLAVPSSWKRP